MSVAPSPSNPRVRELVRRLDEAMGPPDDAGRCRGVKQVLEETFAAGTEFLDERFLVPNPARYARRLVYRDPDDRYTVLPMVWNVGQGTPLHDHAGIWCVECVSSSTCLTPRQRPASSGGPMASSRRRTSSRTRGLLDRKSTRLNSSHIPLSRMPSSA